MRFLFKKKLFWSLTSFRNDEYFFIRCEGIRAYYETHALKNLLVNERLILQTFEFSFFLPSK